MKNKTLHIISGLRINNIVIAFICCLISLQKLGTPATDINASIGIIIVVLLMMGMNLFNDVFDMRTDSINRPERILILHPYLKRYFILTGFLFLISAIALSFFLNYHAMIIVFSAVIFLTAYTPVFKKMLFLGNFLIAFFLGLVFLFIEVVTVQTFSILLAPAMIAFSISLIREIIKDIEDYEGDKSAQIYTAAVYFGVKKVSYLSAVIISFFIISFGYVVFHSPNLYFHIAVFFLVFFPLFYLIFFLIKSPTTKACSRASNLLKKITILGLLIIYIM